MADKELIVFDFDYTLAKTYELIWVWSPRGTRKYKNKKYIPVHPSILSKHKMGDDEKINNDSFKEFYSLDIIKTKPITLTINLLKYYLSNCHKYKVYIVSARPQVVEKNVISFLNLYDVNTTNLNYIGLTNSDPKAKIDCVENIVNKDIYNSVSIYEDNKYIIDNINKKIKQTVRTFFIELLGNKIRITYNENS
tara:strand:+ start:561 stop:1142 length:582 start_codon:yes stop_codon:yes gene_type:complete